MTSVCQLFIYNSLKFVATLFKILICESNCLFMKKVNRFLYFLWSNCIKKWIKHIVHYDNSWQWNRNFVFKLLITGIYSSLFQVFIQLLQYLSMHCLAFTHWQMWIQNPTCEQDFKKIVIASSLSSLKNWTKGLIGLETE